MQDPADQEGAAHFAAQRTPSLSPGGGSHRIWRAELKPALRGALHAQERQVNNSDPVGSHDNSWTAYKSHATFSV